MKNFIKNLKVRKKILLIISINLFFTVLMTVVSNYSLRKIDAVKEHIVKIGIASTRQLGADKMCDAIKGDVLNSFVLAHGEASKKVILKKEFADHVNAIKSDIEAIKLSHVSPKVDENVQFISNALNEYLGKSSELINKTLYFNLDIASTEGKIIYDDFQKSFRRLEGKMGSFGNVIAQEYVLQNEYLNAYSKQIQYTLIFLAFAVTLIAVSLSLYVSKLIETPVLTAEKVLADISSGVITEPIAVEGEDESAHMLRSLNKVVQNLENVKEFVTEVGQGNFDSQIAIFENKGQIYNSLQSMSEAIQSNVEAEKKRNWTSEGLAKFVDITRDIQDVDVFYNNILSNLIRYVNANQGYLYVINDDNPELPFMETKAVYAYGKQRYLEEKKEIFYKQGLVGQAWFDKEPLYFTEIPTDFVNITSGIGEATPTCVFIVPLLVNETIYGVIEIASFQAMKDYEKDFVIKLSETIASTVSSAKTNERTKKLLQESQQAQQAMVAQEEEIRQNMEEMQATQAEMERMQRKMMEDKRRVEEEFEAQLKIIDNIAIVSKTDVQGNITYVNDNFCKWAKYSREEVMGQNHRILKSGDQDDAIFDEMWKTISSGRIFRGEIKNKAKDGSFYWVDAIVAPVMDANGKPKEYIAQRFVINDQIADRERMQQVLEETRAQEEEIRQNMEEMTSIQEQMEISQREIEAQMNIINSVAIVSRTDLAGNITYVNEEFLKWSKYSMEEVMGQNHRMLKSGDQDDQIFVDMWKTISSGKIFRGEIKNKAKDGSFYWVDAIIAPVMDENGKPKEYIAQRFVINDQKEKEAQLNELLRKLDSK